MTPIKIFPAFLFGRSKQKKIEILFHAHIKDERRMEEHNVTVVVEFAIALMSVLDQINRESFQRFRLRIGLNHGRVNHFFLIKTEIKINSNPFCFVPIQVRSLRALLVLKSHNTIFGAIPSMWHHVWIRAV